MARSALSIMKDLFSRDPLAKIEKKIVALHQTHKFTKEERKWVNDHRKMYEIEEKELQIRYMQAELDHFKNG